MADSKKIVCKIMYDALKIMYDTLKLYYSLYYDNAHRCFNET